ncbi:MAG: N-acetylmuramoyl-L-alanine amidase family protein [Candidatus Limnocylindria bacterium]
MRAFCEVRLGALLLSALLTLTACGAQVAPPASQPPAAPTSRVTPAVVGSLEPVPASLVYAPNPGAVVVAIDAGHGGCLDWGVPDPSARGVELAEKTLTLAIARRLRDLLVADGIGVVMTRDGDDALAGDDHPALDCHGPPWRDVNGDGYVGFGGDLPKGTRTRDELQARLDLVNLAGADLLISIHINSPSEAGETIEVAFTQTYYTDETAWAQATARLAADVQSELVAGLGGVAEYDRGDRGIIAHNLYLVAPPLEEPTEERTNPLAQPARGALMPAVLSEVGSITVRAEHDLLASAEGQQAAATGLFHGIARWFADRPLAARIALADVAAGAVPEVVGGTGPPFWASVVEGTSVELQLTNSGTASWPSGGRLLAGWEATDQPYLRAAPLSVSALDLEVPELAPGESVNLHVVLPQPPGGRAVAWISLKVGERILADEGLPALQVSTEAP